MISLSFQSSWPFIKLLLLHSWTKCLVRYRVGCHAVLQPERKKKKNLQIDMKMFLDYIMSLFPKQNLLRVCFGKKCPSSPHNILSKTVEDHNLTHVKQQYCRDKKIKIKERHRWRHWRETPSQRGGGGCHYWIHSVMPAQWQTFFLRVPNEMYPKPHYAYSGGNVRTVCVSVCMWKYMSN